MSNLHSTPAAPSGKPSKPYPEFPLTPHPRGQWCKKIRGKLYYFGPIDDPDAALDKYLAQKDDLHAGRTPRVSVDVVTVKDVVNAFLNHKAGLRDTGELSPHTWVKYKDAAELVIVAFGKGRLASDLRQDDFASLRKRMANAAAASVQ